jgi:hypothetical protein
MKYDHVHEAEIVDAVALNLPLFESDCDCFDLPTELYVIWLRRVISEAGLTTSLGDFHLQNYDAVYVPRDQNDLLSHRSFCVTDQGPEETSFLHTSLPLPVLTIVISCPSFVV